MDNFIYLLSYPIDVNTFNDKLIENINNYIKALITNNGHNNLEIIRLTCQNIECLKILTNGLSFIDKNKAIEIFKLINDILVFNNYNISQYWGYIQYLALSQ